MLLTLDERQQIRVDLVFVRRAHAVRQTRIDFQCRTLDQLDAGDRSSAEAEVKAMCERLLANPVIETYRISLAE